MLAAVAGAWLCVGTALAGDPPPSAPHTAADPNRFAVTGGGVARRLFHLADSRRVDFAIIGDSNVRNSVVSGHEDGMARALAARFGCYATRVDPFIGMQSWGASVSDQSTFGYPPFRLLGSPEVPAAAAQYGFPDTWFPASFGYLPAGVSLPYDYNAGLKLSSTSIIDITLALRYHATQYRWRTPTNGELVLTARGPAYTNFAASTFPTASATPGLADVSLDVPAGARDAASGLWFVPGNAAAGHATRGPFFGLWQRVESPAQATGIAYSPLLYQGGRSARAACVELNGITPASPALGEWLRQVTRLQNADPVLCIQIIHGGNDTLDHAPSVGPIGGLDSATPDGHADNLRGIIADLRSAWQIAGYPPENLFFILGPYHPRGDRLDLEKGYEAQWTAIALDLPNTIAVRGTELSTEQEFIDNGWMRTATDFAHLSVAGYRAWGVTTVEALQRAACPADLNHDRSCSIEDVFVYLNGYFTLSPAADFDGDGATMLEDLFAFLGAWFEGC